MCGLSVPLYWALPSLTKSYQASAIQLAELTAACSTRLILTRTPGGPREYQLRGAVLSRSLRLSMGAPICSRTGALASESFCTSWISTAAKASVWYSRRPLSGVRNILLVEVLVYTFPPSLPVSDPGHPHRHSTCNKETSMKNAVPMRESNCFVWNGDR